MRGSDVNWEGAAYLGVTEQPDLRGPRYVQRENTGRAERRIPRDDRDQQWLRSATNVPELERTERDYARLIAVAFPITSAR